MNRRQKIIVTVTGIFIVLIALLGLTFAYFLTQIRGNEETKSISVTTANLLLEYKDGNGKVELSNLMPGEDIPTKTFTVTNKGNGTVENYKVYLENVQNQLELKDDLKYTLICKSYHTIDTTVDFSTLTEDGACTGASSTTFPSVMSVIATNTIDVGYTHRYELKLEYKYQETDQSIDMNKLVQAKVNLYDGKTKFLAREVMDNVLASTSTKYVEPNMLGVEENTSIPAVSASLENERVLSYTMDDYGTSYYYRGNVIDNYVNFAGMCWRIVRIEGDGSTKLILEDSDQLCDSKDDDGNLNMNGNWDDGQTYNYGFINNGKLDMINYEGATYDGIFYPGLASSFQTFQTTKLKDRTSKLKVDEWCYDDTITEIVYEDVDGNPLPQPTEGSYTNEYYGTYTRINKNKKPSLICTGTKLTKFKDGTNMYAATLTADEISLAGATLSSNNYNFYLINNYTKNNRLHTWTFSPYSYYVGIYGGVFKLLYAGNFDITDEQDSGKSRPAITLVNDITVTTNSDIATYGQPGTINNPYVIN